MHLLHVLLQQQADAQQQDIERQEGNQDAYRQHDACENLQEPRGPSRIQIVAFHFVGMGLQVLHDVLVSRIGDFDNQA